MPRNPDIDAWLAAAPDEHRHRLSAVRDTIAQTAPDASEKMSYGLPTWHDRENLIHLGLFKRHIGLYPGPEAITAFRDALARFTTSKGAIQIPHDRPLPLDLVRQLVEWRLASRRV